MKLFAGLESVFQGFTFKFMHLICLHFFSPYDCAIMTLLEIFNFLAAAVYTLFNA